MSARVADRAAQWIYRGVWGVVTDLFRVPPDPPSLPTRPGESAQEFHPAPGFLRYLKFWFWIALLAIDIAILVAWIALTVEHPIAGALLAIPAFLIAVVPDVIAYVAIHLRYDTTWYVMTPRSLRLRRGIWIINEVTITFENVQNVRVNSGPVQRWFGIADVVLETAGAGAAPGGHGGAMNQALIQGIADAPRVRDLVMARVRASRTAGLGDESKAEVKPGAPAWTPAHLDALRGIRTAAAAIAGSRATG